MCSRKCLGLILVFAFSINHGIAQLVGGKAYMKGDYVELAIDDTGKEGTEPLADDSTYHFRGGFPSSPWGFVANPQMDGWVNYDGDFFTPGAPECGFGLTYKLLDVDHYYNNNYNVTNIPGEIIDYTETVDSVSVTWEGQVDSLQITLLYELRKDELLYTTTVSLLNIGGNTFTDVYYYHSFDPDNNQTIEGSYVTKNAILSQSNVADDSVKVRASQEVPWVSEVFLLAKGTDWKGAHGGFSNRDGEAIWNGFAGLDTTEGSELIADQAIALSHKTDLITPGKSTGMEFSFGTAFAADPYPHGGGVIDDASVNENQAINFDIYPNPATNVVYLKADGVYSVELINIHGQCLERKNGQGTTVLSLNGFDKGIYFVRVKQNDFIQTKKLVIK